MKTKGTAISILAAALLIGGAIMLAGRSSSGTSNAGVQVASADNVSVVDGKQVIDITAKGGYSPRVTIAKADMPTTLRLNTNGTFDCSSSVSIPALSYRSYLPQTGVTEVDVPPQRAGTTLQGRCAMGMYNFKVSFN